MFNKIKKPAAKFVKNKLQGMIGGFGDDDRLLMAKSLLLQQSALTSKNIQDYEFKVFSQFGDDGIIQYLIRTTKIINPCFIEFGVEDYSESNTRFLLMNNNWPGFVLDGSPENIKEVTRQPYYWKHDLRAEAAFITTDNINALMAGSGWEDIGLLSIDIDGNDYWVLKEMDLSRLRPTILVLEYNSVLGPDRAITIPYKPDFQRTNAHFSNLYWGASLKALAILAQQKGYAFIGCNSAGINAYFVKEDRLNGLSAVPIDKGYVQSKFRESRDPEGMLNFLRREERLTAIKGLPVFNIETQGLEKL